MRTSGVSVLRTGLLVSALFGCAEFANGPERTPALAELIPWPDSVMVGDVDTLALNITLPSGTLISGITVDWQANVPSRLTLTKLPPATATLRDSLLVQLRIEAIAVGRGPVLIAATVRHAGFGTLQLSDSIMVLERWTAVAAGEDATCALNSRKQAYCWGTGLLGNGSDGGDSIPSFVLGDIIFRSIDAGDGFMCGVTEPSGRSFCWGGNAFSNLGTGTTNPELIPRELIGGRTYASLHTGGRMGCGITGQPLFGGNNFNTLCWGTGWAWPGTGTPAVVVPLGGSAFLLSQLSTGWHHVCGVTPAGTAYCWGDNALGQLGDGSSGPSICPSEDGEIDNLYGTQYPCSQRPIPVSAPAGAIFASVTAGATHTCGLTTTGLAYCWGDNRFGQLGDGSTSSHRVPVLVTGGHTFLALSAGGYIRIVENQSSHTCGITTAFEMLCWGDNRVGQLGLGNVSGPEVCDPSGFAAACSTRPVSVIGGLRFGSVSVGAGNQYGFLQNGEGNTCGVSEGGALYCWGSNAFGKLGNRSLSDSVAVPTRVEEPR